MVGDEPLRTVEITALLAVGKGEHQVAGGREALSLEPYEIGREVGHLVLDVVRAATVEPPVAFRERERVHRPVFGPRLHDVEMGDEEDRFATGAVTAVADNDILMRGMWAEKNYIAIGETGGLEPRGEDLRRRCRAICFGRVDRNQFRQDIARQPLVLDWRKVLRARRERSPRQPRHRGSSHGGRSSGESSRAACTRPDLGIDHLPKLTFCPALHVNERARPPLETETPVEGLRVTREERDAPQTLEIR